MKRTILTLAVSTLALGFIAYAPIAHAMDTTERSQQLEAYEAQTSGGVSSQSLVQEPLAVAIAPAATTTTTTTEKMTTTNYTVSTRKVGLVGKRPYPAVTSEVAGGVVKDTIVNGTQLDTEVVVPDTAADSLKNEAAEGDYYSAKPEAQIYAKENSNVRVHKMGHFN